MFTDVLITDYSSIAVDFCLTNRPIIFYIYDYNEYISKCRTLYCDIRNVAPRPFAYTQEELFSFLRDMSWYYDPKYRTKYEKFKEMFHKYKDGNSCERVENLLETLFK